MNTFTPFQSLIGERKSDEYLKKYSKHETIVTEKLHGCNFSIYIDEEGQLSFASRQRMLEENSNLYNFRSYFTKEKCEKISTIAKNMRIGNLRIIGELYGSSKIQKDFKYFNSGTVDFNVFYVELDNTPLSWSIDHDSENQYSVVTISKIFGLEHVPVISIGPLEEVYAADIGMSHRAETSQICEGYCYRVTTTDLTEYENGLIILKKRSEKFLETSQLCVSDNHLAQIESAITLQRANNILSKGYEGSMKNGKLTFLMWKDIAAEYDDIPKHIHTKSKKLYENKMMETVKLALEN